MAKKPINYTEPEIPVEFKLKYTIRNGTDKFKDEIEVWRIFILKPDGTLSFLSNNKTADWKSERNAKEYAEWFNKHPSNFGMPDCIAVVRKCRLICEEI